MDEKIEKKVGCLYRVSTKKQVKQEDDIPMQRNACIEFIERKKNEGWVFFKEYVEPGVSGYHKGINERQVLQDVIKDVTRKEIDILLVFMFDRLGRRDDETPFLIERIVDSGVQVWSVCEGQQKFENTSDNLLNIIRFWGANSESKKTAIRVDSARSYATKKGKFTGGVIPYGFKLVPTGKLDKKGRMINDFVKDTFESSIVEEIYTKLIDDNMTLNGIMMYLNEERKLMTRKGKKWNTSTLRNMLRNPVYKGYIAYGKTRMQKVKEAESSEITRESFLQREKRQRSVPADQWIIAEEVNPAHVIVSEERWQMAQDILARRYKKYTDNLRPTEDRTWKSSLLLVGLLECGYCHGRISPAVSSQKIEKKNGEVTRCYTDFYKCNTRGRGKKLCASKSYISRYKLEKAVLEEVNSFLDRVEKIDCTEEIKSTIMKQTKMENERFISTQKELGKVRNGIERFKEEMYRAIVGESDFDRKYINEGLKKAEEKEKELLHEIGELEKNIQAKQVAIDEYMKTVQMVPMWREVFENAPLNIKKHLLSILIENIVVTGNQIDIHFKMDIDSFLCIDKIDDLKRKSYHSDTNNTYRKIIEETVNVNKKSL